MFIYNGQLTSSLELQPWNRSFRYGDGLFETIRVFRGVPILVQQHLDRLRKGMAILGLQADWNSWPIELRDSFAKLLSSHELAGPGRLRLHVWRSGAGAYEPKEDGVEWIVEYQSIKQEYFEYPESITVSDYHGMTIHDHALSRIKIASALPYVLAARQARDAGTDDALLYNSNGEIAEASASNLFMLRKQKLITPPLSSGCLEGTMRAKLIQLVISLPFEVEEKAISSKELRAADAAFLTNSIRGIQPISAYLERKWDVSDWQKVFFLQKSWLQFINSLV